MDEATSSIYRFGNHKLPATDGITTEPVKYDGERLHPAVHPLALKL